MFRTMAAELASLTANRSLELHVVLHGSVETVSLSPALPKVFWLHNVRKMVHVMWLKVWGAWQQGYVLYYTMC